MSEMVLTAVLRVPSDKSAQDVMDWFEREAPQAGISVTNAFVQAFLVPRGTEDSSTELGQPES